MTRLVTLLNHAGWLEQWTQGCDPWAHLRRRLGAHLVFARVPWFLISIVLTVWGWGIALAQMWHFRHENRRPDRSAPSYHRPRSPAPQSRPPAPRPRQAPQPRPAARRPAGQGPGEPARRVPGKRGKHQDGPLGPEARITLAAEREASGVEEILASLDRDLVGLRPVKQKVEEIAALLMVDRSGRGSAWTRPGRTCTCASPAPRAPARPPWRCAWPTCCTGSATWSAGIWSTPCATTWSASTSGRPRPRPSRSSSGPRAGCCSSTRRTTCTGPTTPRTTARNRSRSCSR